MAPHSRGEISACKHGLIQGGALAGRARAAPNDNNTPPRRGEGVWGNGMKMVSCLWTLFAKNILGLPIMDKGSKCEESILRNKAKGPLHTMGPIVLFSHVQGMAGW